LRYLIVTINPVISYEQALKVNKKGMTGLIGSVHSIGLIGSPSGCFDWTDSLSSLSIVTAQATL
jgi:hypothetical protein